MKKSEVKVSKENLKSEVEESTFFPITEFLKGDISNMKSTGINPLKYKLKNGKIIDSAWIKMESVDFEFLDFITPQIDSANDAKYYSESKFFDNTINAFTLSYDLKENHPESKNWTQWDVYINPETNLVFRIYMVKQIDSITTKQLTWMPGRSCKIITMKNNNNHTLIENEIYIKW